MSWLRGFYYDIKAWRTVKQVCKENKDRLDKLGLKMDWIGRVYKVINRDPTIPLGSSDDEVILSHEFQELGNLFIELNLADIVIPSMFPIETEGANAYLVIYTPGIDVNRAYLTVKSAILMFLLTLILSGGFITGLTYLIYTLTK